MTLIKHIGRLLVGMIAYGTAERKPALVILVLVGLLLVALTLAAQVAAPIVVYPFV